MQRSIAMLDSSLDIAALAERGVTFTTKKAFIAEDILKQQFLCLLKMSI